MWQPEQYTKFFEFRALSVYDLLARLPEDFKPKSIIDLGCGQGLVTRYLASVYPKAKIIGIDNSDAMLDQARISYPKLTFTKNDIADFKGSYDLIFSNAALHWLSDLESTLKKIMDNVNPGGYFAVQIPANFNAPSHSLLREIVASRSEWLDKMQNGTLFREFWSPEDYYYYWRELGYSVNVWTTTYYQDLPGENPVVEWVKGAILSEMRARLTVAEVDEIISLYTPLVNRAYPRDDKGITMFPFTRLFFIVHKK